MKLKEKLNVENGSLIIRIIALKHSKVENMGLLTLPFLEDLKGLKITLVVNNTFFG